MQIKARNRYWQSETPRAGTPWVQVHDAGTFALARFVRVPTDDNLELSSRGIDVKLLNVVQNVYQGRANAMALVQGAELSEIIVESGVGRRWYRWPSRSTEAPQPAGWC